MIGEIKINNLSWNALLYPYVVAFLHDGEIWYWGSYCNERDAQDAAKERGGFVIGNLRVSTEK